MDEEDEPPWHGLVFGAGYALVGASFILASRRVGRIPADVLTTVGVVLVAAGAWTLLILGGIYGLIGLTHLPRLVRYGVVLAAVIALIYVLPWWLANR